MPFEALARARVKAGAFVVDNGFRGLSRVTQRLPMARLDRHGVERIRDVAYLDSGLPAHRLDIYRPQVRSGRMPVVFYVHGGGFRILSKDSHWLMGLAFARAGYLVFNVDYRLAPEHPYPAAIEDVCAAWSWVRDNAEDFGGDPGHIVAAGESAGANLVTALTVATSYARPEEFTRPAFEAGQPRAVVAGCGMLQVSDPERFARRRKLRRWVRDRLEEVNDAYLVPGTVHASGGTELADPLLVLESDRVPDRALPPMFAFAGTRDPLLDDTRRLGHALERRGVHNEIRIYAGEIHAFHAMLWRRQAWQCWRETFAFLDGVPPGN